MNPHSTPLRFTRQARAIENSLFKKKKKLQDELSGLHRDCGIVGKNQMLSTSFNQVFFCIIRSLIFIILIVNSVQQLCPSCHRPLLSRASPGEPPACAWLPRVCVPVCCALSCVPCDLPHLVFVCISRPVVQGGRKASRCCCTPGVPLHSERAPRQDTRVTRESFLAELQDRQTKERTAASGLQWWFLLHRLFLRSVEERKGPGSVHGG